MVKIYTHFSDSHSEMYEKYFKSSLRRLYTKEQVGISCCHHTQTTTEGMFMSHGWLDSMEIKLDVILKAIDENKNGWFVFSDCDIQFLRPFINDVESELANVDIVCQNDCDSLCAGFFACKSNNNTLNLFKAIKQNFRHMVNDQVALNELKHLVNYKLLDKQKYFTIGNFFNNIDGTHNWDNVTSIEVPNTILLHHANYVKGTDNKLKLLESVKTNFNTRFNS
jgi:Nucleotide-diphospho-sugar transferase